MSDPIDYESRSQPAKNDVTAPVACPKCNSIMEMGTIGTRGGFGNALTPAWFFYVGKFQPGFIGYAFQSLGEYPVVPCRCVKCGFVEFYAPKP